MGHQVGSAIMEHTSLSIVPITLEQDVVQARRQAREIAEIFGLAPHDQSRIATAVSEIARNAFEYAGGGTVEFLVDSVESPRMLLVRISDSGPGIEDPEAVLSGKYQSATGMGLGIVGARRLTDHFELASSPAEGTRVVFGKRLPRSTTPPTPLSISHVISRLASSRNPDLVHEVRE